MTVLENWKGFVLFVLLLFCCLYYVQISESLFCNRQVAKGKVSQIALCWHKPCVADRPLSVYYYLSLLASSSSFTLIAIIGTAKLLYLKCIGGALVMKCERHYL